MTRSGINSQRDACQTAHLLDCRETVQYKLLIVWICFTMRSVLIAVI